MNYCGVTLPEIFPQLSHSVSYRDSIYVNFGVITIGGSLLLGSRYCRELLTDVNVMTTFWGLLLAELYSTVELRYNEMPRDWGNNYVRYHGVSFIETPI